MTLFLGLYKTQIGGSLKQVESQATQEKGPKNDQKTQDRVSFETVTCTTNTDQGKQWKKVKKSEVTPFYDTSFFSTVKIIKKSFFLFGLFIRVFLQHNKKSQ